MAIKSATSLRNGTYILDKLYPDLKEIESIEQLPNNQDKLNIETISFRDKIILQSLNYQYSNASQYALEDISITINKKNCIKQLNSLN